MQSALPREGGTYALLLHTPAKVPVLAPPQSTRHLLSSGFYIYVGSAFGPGGLRARIGRHCRKSKTIHWHIDRLTTQVPVCAVWISAEALEHQLARHLAQSTAATVPIAGFGASDCQCPAHLLHYRHRPQDDEFLESFERCSVY
ncbi:MAG: GIY-YIG nuclease family protein [Pseudomonadota bacterium]